jgi:hypothetical protein
MHILFHKAMQPTGRENEASVNVFNEIIRNKQRELALIILNKIISV